MTRQTIRPTVVPLPTEPVMPRGARWIRPLDEVLGTDEDAPDDSADWIQRDYLARSEPGIFAGAPKCGKTWLALDIAIATARGEDWLSIAGANTVREPARVLVLALEDHVRRLRSRIWGLMRGRGLTPNDPTLRGHLSISSELLRFPDGSDQQALLTELRQWRPTLVLMDCLTRIMSGDPNSTRDAAAFTNSWIRICRESGASVVLIHHVSKPQAGRSGSLLDTVRGSGDFVAAARHVVIVERLDVGDQTRTFAKLSAAGNLDVRTRERAIELVRSEHEGGREVVRIVDRGDPAGVARSKGHSLRDRVVAVAQAQAYSSRNELADATGGKRQQVLRAIADELSPEGRLEVHTDGSIRPRSVPF
jgi:hypothetical protein